MKDLKHTNLFLALAFAAVMLVVSVLLDGAPQSNTVLLMLIGLYFVVSGGLVGKAGSCRRSSES